MFNFAKKITMRLFSVILLITFFVNSLTYGQQPESEISSMQEQLKFLASDSLKGRFPGTPEDAVAASFILEKFLDAGLKPLDDNGMQYFSVVTSVEATSNNKVQWEDAVAEFQKDFSLYAFSSNASIEAEVVFAGYGLILDLDSLQWNDYKSVDATGKWVLVLEGDPEPENNDSPFIPFANVRSKALHARDQGALGLLVVGGSRNDAKDEITPLLFERSVISSGIPVIDLKRSWVNAHMLPEGWTTDSLETLANDGVITLKEMGNEVFNATTELERQEVRTQNIVAYLPGSDPELKQEFVVLGAHYDHLGMGGQGSGSRTPDTIAPHYGADDNGSGVVGLIAMAQRMAELEEKPARSLVFAAFGAEELGLLGSRYLAKNAPFEAENMHAMVNFDMIGRLNEQKSIAVGGTGTAVESEDLLNELKQNTVLGLSYSPEGFGASDHASFYAEDIPVFFISTGAHSDYHTPADTWDKINYEGMELVLDFSEDLLLNLMNRPERLSFQEAGPKERTSGRRGFKVTLGIMPDFTSESTDGLGVGGVTKGGPAERAGMLKGDKIIGINGMPVQNIYDYMNRLKQLKAGERANVDVNRNGEELVLIVEL
jgi:aminopeptidase YwaD